MIVVFFADDSVSLYNTGIHTNSDLFVWNGREVRKGNSRTVNWENLIHKTDLRQSKNMNTAASYVSSEQRCTVTALN